MMHEYPDQRLRNFHLARYDLAQHIHGARRDRLKGHVQFYVRRRMVKINLSLNTL
jgi:hypothetical protein